MASLRKQLLDAPQREYEEELRVSSAYIVPNGKKHESGYSCMTIVGVTEHGIWKKTAGNTDDIMFNGGGFRMDCIYPDRIIHIWNSHSKFTISYDASSVEFTEVNYGKN